MVNRVAHGYLPGRSTIIGVQVSRSMQVVLGLGGNRGEVAAAFAAAAGALASRFRLLGHSSVWRSVPLGPPQPDFLNAALLLDVDVDPHRLLAICQGLEVVAGRCRELETRDGPRTLDLDILLVRGVVVVSPALAVPHPRLAVRRFALLPASEVAPGWEHPRVHRSLSDLAATVYGERQECQRVAPFPEVRR